MNGMGSDIGIVRANDRMNTLLRQDKTSYLSGVYIINHYITILKCPASLS